MEWEVKYKSQGGLLGRTESIYRWVRQLDGLGGATIARDGALIGKSTVKIEGTNGVEGYHG